MESRLPLIGREDVLRRIVQAHRHALDGGRVMVTIVGERGSGRSRLLGEIALLPEFESSLVVSVRLTDKQSEARDVFDRALKEHLTTRRAIPLSQIPTAQDAVGVDSPSSTEILRSLGAVMPLVITVNNIDANRAAAAALGEMLGGVDVPWLLVATTDPGQMSASMMVARATEATVVQLQCELFDHEASAALLRALTGAEPNTADVAWLVEHTRGLPVLMREAITAAVRCGAYVREHGTLRRVNAIEDAASDYFDLIPLSVPDLAVLDTEALNVLGLISLLGARVPRHLLPVNLVDDASIATLLDTHLLEEVEESLATTSTLVHQAALAHARTTRLSERNVEFLRSLFPAWLDGTLQPANIAVKAVVNSVTEADERCQLLASMLDAACALAKANDYRGAAVIMGECYDQAVLIVDDQERLGRWFESYATVLYVLGRIEEQHRCVEAFLSRNYNEDQVPPEVAPTVARALMWSAEYHEREKLIAAALTLLERAEIVSDGVKDDHVARGLRYRMLLGRARLFNVAERREDSIAILRALLDEVDEESDLATAFDALIMFSRIVRNPTERDEASRRLADMLTRCESDGLQRAAIQLRAAQIGLHIHDDDFDRFETAVRALIEQMRKWSLPRTESNAWVWLAMMLAERGEHGDATYAIDRAIEIRWRVNSVALWQIAMITRAQILTLAHRDDEAIATIAHIDNDARTYGRPCRRFLLDLARATISIRSGEWLADVEALAALRAIGERENFDGIEGSLLETEGEFLLHGSSIDRERARSFGQRVLALDPKRLGTMRLNVIALAIVARAGGDHESVRTKHDVAEGLVDKLRTRVVATFEVWIERGAQKNLVDALTMLRAHAPRVMSSADFESLASHTSNGYGGLAWHHCEVQTFGVVRVIDAAGTERGGRHFGQHKTDSKPKKMLAALTVAAILGKRLKRERLIDMVWGESVAPETAVNNFHVTLSGLRQVVGDVVDFDGNSYSLNTRLVSVDAIHVVEMVDAAFAFQRSGLLFRAYDSLRAASAMVHGEFLDGIYDDWTDGARDLLRSRVRAARVRIAEIALARGEGNVARHQVGELLDSDPLDEDAIYLHLLLLIHDGERLRVIREYEQLVERLEKEYGSKPSARLQGLRQKISDG